MSKFVKCKAVVMIQGEHVDFDDVYVTWRYLFGYGEMSDVAFRKMTEHLDMGKLDGQLKSNFETEKYESAYREIPIERKDSIAKDFVESYDYNQHAGIVDYIIMDVLVEFDDEKLTMGGRKKINNIYYRFNT